MANISEHYVSYASDKKIHYLAAGPINGPQIMFIHGWPATAITCQCIHKSIVLTAILFVEVPFSLIVRY